MRAAVQGVKSLFLAEFVSAFFLAMRYFFVAEEDAELSVREGAVERRASAASMRCAVIPTAKERCIACQALPKPSVRRRPSPSRPGRGATTARGARRATTSTWSNASIAASARRPARWTPSSRGRISNSRQRRARSFSITRSVCSRTAIAGSGRSRRTLRSTRLYR